MDLNKRIETEINLIKATLISKGLKCGANVLKNVGLYTAVLTKDATQLIDIMQKYFKRLPSSKASDGWATIYRSKLNDMLGYSDFTIYDGVVIMCKYETTKNDSFTLKLITLRTKKNVKVLDKFVDRIFKDLKHSDYKRSQESYISFNQCSNGYRVYKKLRTFDDVFVPEDIKKEIQLSLIKFIKKKEWYADRNLPYHFGILLHGEPGGGKTSLAQAIASFTHSTCMLLMGDNLREIDNVCCKCSNPNERNTVIIEDIDCGFFENKTVTKRDKQLTYEEKDKEIYRKQGLATILNNIDGLEAPDNVIYVFTTNHIEVLDPALIRPGRIDLQIEIKPVDMETFKQFVNYHYKTMDIPDINIKPGISFATLQTLVMKDYTLQQIIDFVSVKEEPIKPDTPEFQEKVNEAVEQLFEKKTTPYEAIINSIENGSSSSEDTETTKKKNKKTRSDKIERKI